MSPEAHRKLPDASDRRACTRVGELVISLPFYLILSYLIFSGSLDIVLSIKLPGGLQVLVITDMDFGGSTSHSQG